LLADPAVDPQPFDIGLVDEIGEIHPRPEIGGDGTPFKGLIDDVVFFARALSASEIAVLATH
jgi:hypothetical protein